MTERNPLDVLRAYSVGTAAQWCQAGLSEWHLKSLTRQGLLVRVHHGVYVTAAALASSKRDREREHALLVLAARVATSLKTVASHESAALLHGIALLRAPVAGRVSLTCSPGTRGGQRTKAGIVIRAAELPPEHLTRRFKVPVTTPARTVADLARSSEFMAGVVAADSALRQSKTTKPLIADVLAACQKWPGLSRARRVADFSDERSESVLESCARVVFAHHKLPRPSFRWNWARSGSPGGSISTGPAT